MDYITKEIRKKLNKKSKKLFDELLDTVEPATDKENWQYVEDFEDHLVSDDFISE